MNTKPIIELSVGFEPIAGEDDWLDEDGWPASHYNFHRLTPTQLLTIARDLVEAEAAGNDGRRVLQSYRRLDLAGLLRDDDWFVP